MMSRRGRGFPRLLIGSTSHPDLLVAVPVAVEQWSWEMMVPGGGTSGANGTSGGGGTRWWYQWSWDLLPSGRLRLGSGEPVWSRLPDL